MDDPRSVIEEYGVLASSDRRAVALDCLAAGIAAAHPRRVVRDAVAVDGDVLRIDGTSYDLGAFEELIVLGGGKAAAQVAVELERALGDRLDGGVVVTDAPEPTDRVTVRPGDHPVPSTTGVESTRELVARAETAGEGTLVLGVITGGGSALLPAPAAGIGIDALRETTDALLASGATIHEINAVRKHLSAVKGGRLAALAAPATVAVLVLSDVVGDDLDVIASGPFVPDPSTYDDALAVVDRYDLAAPDAARRRLERGLAGELPETPSADDPAFERVDHHVLADGFTALAAARDRIREAGYEPLVLSSRIRGESTEAAKTAAAIAEEVPATGNPLEPPAAVLSGGETTVTVTGDGTGGPNQEFALAAAVEADAEGVTVAAVDTDGIDGPTDAAGAIVDASAATDAELRDALDEHDVYPVLEERGWLIRTGKTGTNVNDLRVVVIDR